MSDPFKNKSVLITGGTGSFGKRFIETLLEHHEPRRVIVFSRDELKQFEMAKSETFRALDRGRLRYFLGDVRDADRLRQAFSDVQVVIHAAALKQVPACEYNPFEAIKTNVHGAQNIIDVSVERGVERVVALSTDKACNPVNLYGATKLCSEKLFIAGNSYAGGKGSGFAVVRYGNVVGSRGSVVPFFLRERETGRLPVTHPDMTRFWITLQQGVDFVIMAVTGMQGGELFVPKIPSAKILDLAAAIGPECTIDHVGIRPGEKLHEMMISQDDARQTLEFDDHYIITPNFPWWTSRSDAYEGGRPVSEGFVYSSETNDRWLSVEEIREIAAPFEGSSPA